MFVRRSRHLSKDLVYWLYLSIFLQLFSPNGEIVEAKKTATRSGLVAATQVGGGAFGSRGGITNDDVQRTSQDEVSTNITLSPLQQLKRDIMRGYDPSLPPVKDFRDSIDIQVDLTYRQVLDLDEKNQILKSLIWYRQYWTDTHLTWNPADYDGLDQISITASSIWRPDIAVYEEVGTRDLSPRLPFVKLSYNGRILYSEPLILETSCSVNTAFFPFDSQMCTITFVSWTQPVSHIDLRSRQESEVVQDESKKYFIDSGEWVLQNMNVRKQIVTYSTLSNVSQEGRTEDQPTSSGELSSGDGEETAISNTSSTQWAWHSVNDTTVQERSYIKIHETHITTRKEIGKSITDNMFAEVRFALSIRRNSSLYMQSMLFPSILLTSVALLGFYLPPDSGERVGLQITILLTFMVFLLTVGEMFPASTGPYIGIYFVLSMAQLGVNILMTIIVLHLHFKPCVRNKSTWKSERPHWFTLAGAKYEGESMIPVRLRRFLQFCNRYVTIADDGVAWMLPITKSTIPEIGVKGTYRPTTKDEILERESILKEIDEHKEENHDENAVPANKDQTPDISTNHVENAVSTEDLDPEVAITPSKVTKRKRNSEQKDTKKLSVDPVPERRKSSATRDKEIQKMINDFRLDVKGVVQQEMFRKNEEKDTDEEFEESVEKEQEEWKSVARAVDRLFFRFYLFLMFISYIGLGAVAIHGNLTTSWDM